VPLFTAVTRHDARLAQLVYGGDEIGKGPQVTLVNLSLAYLSAPSW